MSVKRLEIHERESYDYYYDYQKVKDGDKTLFSVYNLAECPEDAIIGRSLFDASDWVDAVRYGMRLAEQGFTSIEVSTIKDEEDDEGW